jgi:hypothetical protein
LVLLVNPQICQDNKSLLKHRETTGNWAQGVLLHWYEGWDRFTYVKQSKKWKKKPKGHLLYRINKKKKNSKRGTTLEVKTSSFYWTQQSEDVSPTPSTWQGEEIFGLGWSDLGLLFYRGSTNYMLYVMNHVFMSTIWDMIPYQHLSHDSWPLCFLTPHLVSINIYLCSLVIFVVVMTTKVTESCSFNSWFI